MANQLQNSDLWKQVAQEVRIFDRSFAEQLDAYNKLLTQVQQPKTNLFIRDTDRQFSQANSNWKVLVTVVTVKFRKLIKNTNIER